MVTLMVLLVISFSAAAEEEERYWDNALLTEVDTWRDPGGEGSDLRFDISQDGRRMVMLGFGSPNEIRVVDRDVQTLAVLEPPDPNATVKGVRWSYSDTWVIAWGRAEDEDHDFLAAWNATTFEPSDQLFENDTTPLNLIDAVIFQSFDEILVIGGRDVNGTSRLLIFETVTMRLHRDTPWRDNIPIHSLEWDGMSLVCIEDEGSITDVGGGAWGIQRVMEGRPAMPSASSFPRGGRYPWLVGYEDGWVAIWAGYPVEREGLNSMNTGPIDGLSWIVNNYDRYFLAALRGDDGGSTVSAHIFIYSEDPVVQVSNDIETESPVTMMVPDPLEPLQVWAGLTDGSMVLFNISLIPDLPPVVTIDVPEENQLFLEDFTARGSIMDDNDDIQWVKVSFDFEVWHDANWTNDGWTFEVDVSSVDPDIAAIHVEVSDGKNRNNIQQQFQTPSGEGPDDNGGKFVLDHPVTFFVVIGAIVYLAWRWGRKAKEEPVQ